jgi:uncharacterized protein (DUF3084 family)
MQLTAEKVETESGDSLSAQFSGQLTEVETLIHTLKRTLVHNEEALEHEGIRSDMERLERWLESYRHGLSAATKLATAGNEMMRNIRDRLKLAVEEMHRLEGEGGNPASKSQALEVEQLVAAERQLDALIPSIEQMFRPCEETKVNITY